MGMYLATRSPKRWMLAHPHQHLYLCLVLLPLLLQEDGKEVLSQLKVGLDTQVLLAQHVEGHDVLNPIGFKCYSSIL
jgi:hypothetical protein